MHLMLGFVFTANVIFSRIYLGYHDVPQTFAGFMVGVILSSLYFIVYYVYNNVMKNRQQK